MNSTRALTTARRVGAVTGAALLGVFVLTAPAAAHVSVAADGVGSGSGRVGAIVAALVALTGLVIGGLALARAAGRIGSGSGFGSARDGALVSMVLGLMGVALAVLHLATSTGGLGTGNGRAGAIVAAVLGLIGIALGRATLARSRRTG
ncbi:DUF6223 family protein [Streptomyces sp. NBC_00234]|uniref:DUF6223 family protein n=1 Tax=Streptomyces sp. NBC_00234 TaxID=2903638 RepID=UPI002E2926D4|nr:DUF6223 family protein [Streptomyces sp. NBC_00234]